MWRDDDDGARSAVKQSYRRVTVLVHGIPSLLSFLSPSCLATGRGDGWEGRGLGGGACTTLLTLLCCESPVPHSGHSYYKLYYTCTTCNKKSL